MSLQDIQCVLSALAPEVMLAFLCLATLLVDGFLLKSLTVEKRQEWVAGMVVAGLFLILGVMAFSSDGTPDLSLGNGAFVASRLNSIFKGVVAALAVVTVMIGRRTPFSRHVGECHSLVLFSVLGMFFLISSENLAMIFVALEMTSLPLYALTASQKGARRSIEGGLKYLIFGGLSTAFLLFGLSYIYGVTGQLSLPGIHESLKTGAVDGLMLKTGILFAMAGFGFKIAAVPFHLWAPDVYEGAPAPVAALIASGSKFASFVALAKILLMGLVSASGSVVGWPSHWKAGWAVAVALMAVLSMGLGNLAAIAQSNVKRLLAYSSVAHAGYVLVAFTAIAADGTPAPMALPAIYFYAIVYALTNVGAFGIVHTIASSTGGDDFADFKGAARRAPFLSLLLLVFLLSLAGIPPMAGFFGKFYLFAAGVQADARGLGLLWLVGFAIAMSAVSLYYYLRLARQMYVFAPDDARPVSSGMGVRAALALVCLAVLLLGIFPSRAVGLLQKLQADRDSVVTLRSSTLISLRPPASGRDR